MQMSGTGRKITIWFKEGEIFNSFELGILSIAWPYFYTRIYPKSTNQSRGQVQLLLIHFKT